MCAVTNSNVKVKRGIMGYSDKDIERVLFSEETIAARIKELGAQITADYADKNLLLACTLRGASVFMCDLMREIDLPLEIDFMACSSYGTGRETTGVVKIQKDLNTDIVGRDVLIIEDILDSGITLEYLLRTLSKRNPRSLRVACLLRKEGAQRVNVKCDYVGFECPLEFVVGYGLDFAQSYRNLPYIGVLKPEVYGA